MERQGGLTKDVRVLFQSGVVGSLTDAELLNRFTAGGEGAELAFAVLVERHGPTVLRVCRSVLRDDHDAEDAFQATFLVLARRAASVRKRESVASWLYGVALRVSSFAKGSAALRRLRERDAAEAADSATDGEDREELAALYEEVGRLPERYRSPVVLCYLEGRTCEAAARQLGCPVGTVKSRLARGRERLRLRLSRRGLAPMSGIAARRVPASLVSRTAEVVMEGVATVSVCTLVKGVGRLMAWSNLKGVCSVALILVAFAGIGSQLNAQRAEEPTIAASVKPDRVQDTKPNRTRRTDDAISVKIDLYRLAATEQRKEAQSIIEVVAKNRGRALVEESEAAKWPEGSEKRLSHERSVAAWAKEAQASAKGVDYVMRLADRYQGIADDLDSRRNARADDPTALKAMIREAEAWLLKREFDDDFPVELAVTKMLARIEYRTRGLTSFPTVVGPRASVFEATAIWQAEKFITMHQPCVSLQGCEVKMQRLTTTQPSFQWKMTFVNPSTGQTYGCRTFFSEPTVEEYLGRQCVALGPES